MDFEKGISRSRMRESNSFNQGKGKMPWMIKRGIFTPKRNPTNKGGITEPTSGKKF